MKQNRNRKTVLWLSLLTLGMFAFGYALVPFYYVLCRALGVNSKDNLAVAKNDSWLDKSRIITVQFIANNNANLPWDFYPKTKRIVVYPGQDMKIAFYAKNNSDRSMTVQAVPSISPGLAASHLKKTQCFCFNQQTLKSKQWMDMPVVFHIDNTLPKNINEVTLSYTLFESKKPVTNKPTGRLG